MLLLFLAQDTLGMPESFKDHVLFTKDGNSETELSAEPRHDSLQSKDPS